MRAWVVALLAMTACGGSDGTTIPLTFTPLDLGNVITHGSGTTTVKNVSSSRVLLGGITVTGDGFSLGAISCDTALEAGKTCAITVELAGAHFGPLTGTVDVGDIGEVISAMFSDVVSVAPVTGGRITSAPAGIDCGTTCSAVFDAAVTLTATPDTGRTFGGWSDPSCNTNPSCTITKGSVLSASFKP